MENKKKAANPYEDMLTMPHHISARHPSMPMSVRAAQFSPFAALSEYGDAVKEAARLTEEQTELDPYEQDKLNAALNSIRQRISDRPEISFIWFLPDARKQGGTYMQETGIVKKIDLCRRRIILESGTEIPMEDLFHIEEISKEMLSP